MTTGGFPTANCLCTRSVLFLRRALTDLEHAVCEPCVAQGHRWPESGPTGKATGDPGGLSGKAGEGGARGLSSGPAGRRQEVAHSHRVGLQVPASALQTALCSLDTQAQEAERQHVRSDT